MFTLQKPFVAYLTFAGLNELRIPEFVGDISQQRLVTVAGWMAIEIEDLEKLATY